MPAVKEDLGRMKTQPRPTICKISTGSGSFAYGITSLNIDQPLIILPTSLRVIAFHEANDMLHQGQVKSLDSISFQYFWPEMKKDIQLWVKACPRCQSCKTSRHNRQQLCNYPSNTERLRVLHILSSKNLGTNNQIIPFHTEAFMELMSWHQKQARPLLDNKPFMEKELFSYSKVWVRNSASQNNVAPPYNGPFEVISKFEKYFSIKQYGRIKSVSIDRLKAFIELPKIQPPPPYNLRSLDGNARYHQRLVGKYAVILWWLITVLFSILHLVFFYLL